MAGNIAIWIEYNAFTGTDDTTNSQTLIPDQHQLHLNFWKLEKQNILDVGLKFPNEECTVYCFVDAKDKDIEFSDLGKSLIKDRKIRDAVFNNAINSRGCGKKMQSRHVIEEHIEISALQKHDERKLERITSQSCGGSHLNSFCVVTIENEKIYNLDSNECKNGCIIAIKIEKCKETCCNQFYIRFRIKGNWANDILKIEKANASMLSHYISYTNILDLRINMIRALPDKIIEKLHKNWNVFDVIHCFFMMMSTSELSLSMSPHENVRVLEKNIWIKYLTELNEEKNNSELLAYYWKRKDKKYFILFTKIIISKPFWRNLLLVFILSGFISWVIGTGIDKIIQQCMIN